jgi:DNA polymerase-3 subunit gamma/tau
MKQYKPLYLKYRPQTLSELIGQEVVSRTLTNAIKNNKIVHAYLFCGPRGTGKTSSARILAKSLNCEIGITAQPCGKCVSCVSVTEGNSLDVIEIDAASHRKVEDAEDLINRVNLGTYGSRFKVYIIDEVHMLTDHAFNALLKTLEEPPKNVVFILATTEEYKVIPTIISRCQKLDFKAVSLKDLGLRVEDIAKQEKINIDKTIVDFISRRSNGCLRDAVSLLDQIGVLQVDEKKIEPKEVFELFGTVDRSSILSLVEAVLTFDKKNAIDISESLVKSGKDVEELFKSILEMVIDLSKAKIDEEYKKLISKELTSELVFLNKVPFSHLLKVVDRFQNAQGKLRFALSQELQFMVEIMGLLDEDFLISMGELKERIEKLEKGTMKDYKPHDSLVHREIAEPVPSKARDLSRNDKVNSNPQPPIIAPTSSPSITLTPTPAPHVAISQTPISDLDTLWPKIVNEIESNPTKTLLNQSDSYLLGLNEELLEIGLSKDMFLSKLEKDEKKKESILEAVKLCTKIESKIIKFRFLPRVKPVVEQAISSEQLIVNSELNLDTSDIVKKSDPRPTIHKSLATDDFTKAIEDLLGAKQID